MRAKREEEEEERERESRQRGGGGRERERANREEEEEERGDRTFTVTPFGMFALSIPQLRIPRTFSSMKYLQDSGRGRGRDRRVG